MQNTRNNEFFDYLLMIARLKKSLILTSLIVLILSYTSIYFFIEEKFEATAIIVPTESKGLGGISSIIGSLSNLPLGLGSLSKSEDLERFNTIVFSRSSLEEVINKFDLLKDYDPESMEETIKYFRKNIYTEITDDNSFLIRVRANSRKKSADVTNYFVDLINRRIIDLNISKAKDDREFLENRYNEVKVELARSEDNLARFQERTGVFLVEEQITQSIETYAKLDAELAAKQVELAVANQLYGAKNPQVEPLKLTVNELSEMIRNLKSNKSYNNLLMNIKDMPQNALEYLRHYRDVKIYMAIQEFLVPLYEQSKFEEKKATPVLKVIDYAVQPEKKVYPPRVLFSVGITIFVFLIITSFMFWRQILVNSQNQKLLLLKKELMNFSSKSS